MSGDKKSGDDAKSSQDSGCGFDKMSPYYLSSSDNPGQILTHVQLKGDNYEEWACMFRGALRAKAKTGFVDGLIEQPIEPKKLELWYLINSMVVSWIFNTIEPNLRSTITYVNEANVLWDDLREQFSMGNGPRVHQIKSDIANCKQMKNESVAAYYGRIKKMWDDLNNLDQPPVCSCTGCKCNISAKIMQSREEERVHQFVMSLETPKFENVSSTILNTEPLPNLKKAYANVVREERVKSSTHEDRPEPMSFIARTSAGSHVSEGGRFCTHCKKRGHEIDTCWDLVGYPKHRGERPRARTNQKGRNEPATNFRTGEGRNMVNTRANAVQVGTDINPNLSDAEKATLLGISCEQMDQFKVFMQTQLQFHDRMIGPSLEDADWSG